MVDGQQPAANPLTGGGPTAAPSTADPMQAALSQAHGQSSAQFDKLANSRKILDGVRKAMDSLVKMGDTIEPDNVIKAAGDLTALGLEPAALAQLLSTMPQAGGPALAAWLQQQDAMATQREQAVDQQHQLAAHQMGVDALHLLMHDHMVGKMAGQGVLPGSASPAAAAPAPQSPNPLM
jgi:hypothetical protein